MNYLDNNMRFDLRIIASWVESGSKVLGLGCGEGDLLYLLKKDKNVKETGIEIKEEKVASCIEKGITVLQGDINEEIIDYPDNSFDYVILSQTLQQVYEPEALIQSMMRVGKKGIVSFPNFSHWRIRMQLMATGHVPVTKELPYEWYNTPNIRVLSLKDFRRFSKNVGFSIIKEAAINTGENQTEGKIVRWMPNVFATYGIFLIGNRR
jgi:methionine biosynthesis protein MetW